MIDFDRIVTSQSFSNLRDITFCGDTLAIWHHPEPSVVRASNEPPALSSATTWGCSYCLEDIPLPSSQLTHIDVSLPPEDIFWLLRETSHVTECRIFRSPTLVNEDSYGLISGSEAGALLLNLIRYQHRELLLSTQLLPINSQPFQLPGEHSTTKVTTCAYLLPAVQELRSQLKNVREL